LLVGTATIHRILKFFGVQPEPPHRVVTGLHRPLQLVDGVFVSRELLLMLCFTVLVADEEPRRLHLVEHHLDGVEVGGAGVAGFGVQHRVGEELLQLGEPPPPAPPRDTTGWVRASSS